MPAWTSTTGSPLPRVSYSSSRPSTFADRKSTRLNSSHSQISYAVFCLKKKKADEQALAGDPGADAQRAVDDLQGADADNGRRRQARHEQLHEIAAPLVDRNLFLAVERA